MPTVTRYPPQKSNIVSAQAIALDVDDGLSLKECLKIPFVQNYAAAIYTSASHQKVKGDAPACDRYRIVFVLPKPVTDIALYEQSVSVVMESVGYADKACKDASRMFFGYSETEVILCDNTKVLPANFLTEVGDRLESEKAERARLFEERKRKREEFGEPETDLKTIQLALDSIDPDCPYQDWLTVGLALHSHSESNFYLWDNWSSRGSKYSSSRALERQWSKFTAGGGIGIGSLFHLAKDYGFKFPEQSFTTYTETYSEGDRLLSPEKLGKKKASEFIQWISGKAAGLSKNCHKGFAAAVVPIVEPPKIFRWQNGDPVPSTEDYGDRPIPKIIYKRGSNPVELVAKLRAAGWLSALDSSFMGEGKTHRAGTIKFQDCTGWYIDTNHNNPSVENIERNYTNLWARHNGLWRGEDGNLTRKTIEGKEPEIRANCPSADLFPKLAAKGYETMSKDNPICGVCPHRGYCGISENFFKAQRSTALAAQQIRADIQQLPSPTDWDYSNNYAIVEEATGQARTALKEVSGNWGDLLQNFDAIEAIAPELYEKLKPFKDALRTAFEAPQGRYGLTHDKIIQALPKPPENLNDLLLRVATILEPELNLDEADRVSGAGKKYRAAMKLVNAMYRSEAKQDNETVLEALPNNLLLPLLTLWNGDRGSIRLEKNRLTVTRPDTRKQTTIQAFGFRLFLDATGNKQAIAAGFGLEENSIIEIAQELPNLDNLTVYQTNMSGIKSRDRSDSAKQRIAAYQQAWQKTDPNVQFLGFKSDENIDGWWLNHNRGSNKFKGRLSLVSFGLPFPHVGAIQAEYRTFNGTLDGFEEYYRRLVEDEISQGVGRQRVQHFSDQQFTLDIVATFDDFDLSFLTERYGIKVITRDAVEFCGAAGTTRETLKHSIFDITAGIKAAGEKITQQAIATAMGISQSTLSEHLKALWGNWNKLKKLLSDFLKGSNRVSDKNIKTLKPIEPTLAAATLIDVFSSGGWVALRAFLEDLPPHEARFSLGCLLRTTAIAN